MKHHINKKFSTTFRTFLGLSILSAFTGTYADDTEVFYSANVSKPNLMFVLDISGSMKTIVPNSGTSSGNTSSHTLMRSVVNSGDDAEQASSGGDMRLTDTYFDLGFDHFNFRSTQRSAVRFYNTNIPKDAVITNAYIQFEVRSWDEYSDDFASVNIYAESNDNAKRFKNQNGRRINDRNWSTLSVAWDDIPSWYTTGDRGTDQQTPDISVLVQSLVDRNNWDEDNAMVFMFDNKLDANGNPLEGARNAKSYDRSASDAPSLHVEYTTEEAGSDKMRIEVMQESLRRVLEKAPDNVNVGLMNYGQEALRTGNAEKSRMHSVSGVAFPITDINGLARDVIPTQADVYGLPHLPDETATVREYIADVADSWEHSNYTPIVDSLYEAALYYRGEKVHYGQNYPWEGGAHPSTYDGDVVNTSVFNYEGRVRANAPTYKSPIVSSCQANYIVLMTDGAPTYVSKYGSYMAGPFARRDDIDTGGPQGPLADAVDCDYSASNIPSTVGISGMCGAELTDYLATHDNISDPSTSNPNGQYGDQFIETFTIGFGTNSSTGNYLKTLATYNDNDSSTSDDGYYSATSADELAAAFKSILEAVAAPTGTLASPGYSVNVKNGLENEKDIYIPVFDRKNSSRWTGNLKKFRIVDVDDSRLIRGKNSLNVTDDNGNFTANAWDYWSTSATADGSEVEAGGVANLLTNPAARNIYSNLTGNTDVDLTLAANEISEDNIANIDNTLLDLPDSADLALRKQVVNFMRGYVDGDTSAGARKHMGDMLHSEPVVITYEKGNDGGSGKQQYIFAATNEGYVHAFDAVSGEEKFAFLPKELLKIAEPQFRNAGTQVDHKYGVDGIMNFNYIGGEDGSLDTGDQIILYFGLRRGGSSYYALDVTNIDKPKLLWTKSVSDYASMGLSWSKPYIRKVGKSGSTCVDGKTDCKDVVIISGGYDEDEDRDLPDGSGQVDDATATVVANVGNDVLILDAMNGNLIWSMTDAMKSQITNSIPGGVRAIDSNQNGLVDRMYFADTGANVWRLDLSEAIGDSTAPETILTKLADLGSQGRSTNKRMFYIEPEVSSGTVAGQSVYTVSVGSGFRAHPMDETIDDKFYILVDDSPYQRLDTSTNAYDSIIETDLASMTVSGSTVTKVGSITDSDKRGWAISFSNDGEKVLSPAYSYNGKIIFSTLVPEAATEGIGVDQCSTPITQNNTYIFEVLSGDLVEKVTNPTPGIPNVVQPFFNTFSSVTTVPPGEYAGKVDMNGNSIDEDGNIISVCNHTVDLRKGTDLKELTGYNACTLESVYWSDPVKK